MINFAWTTIVGALTELVFPVFKDVLRTITSTYLDEFANNVKTQIETLINNQFSAAQKKAYEAEQEASVASNSDDVTKYQAVADVWREVAEGLKKENKDLKQKIDAGEAASEDILVWKHKAETWKEAYESLLKDKELLKEEIQAMKHEVLSPLQKSISRLAMTDLFDVSNPGEVFLNDKSPLLNPSSDVNE
jgi:predicted RNase H-like nuclease (RuvC/YqgF family)